MSTRELDLMVAEKEIPCLATLRLTMRDVVYVRPVDAFFLTTIYGMINPFFPENDTIVYVVTCAGRLVKLDRAHHVVSEYHPNGNGTSEMKYTISRGLSIPQAIIDSDIDPLYVIIVTHIPGNYRHLVVVDMTAWRKTAKPAIAGSLSSEEEVTL
jgi:hypothetical protein